MLKRLLFFVLSTFSKKKYLYIDDERIPKTNKPWIIKRNYDNTIKHLCKNGCPNYISFDHDLGDASQKTGYDIAKFIIDMDMDYPGFIPNDFEFNVHSANPVGKQNIIKLFENYFNFKHGV